MRRTRAQIVTDLEAQGLCFYTFTIAHTSPHAAADWDWNQRDLPHIPFVHGGFHAAPGAVEDDLVTAMYVQRFAGVRLPMMVAYHHRETSPPGRVYATTLGPLALVVEATLDPIAEGTRVTTTYSLGAPRALRFLLPLIERYLRRNYARIHDEDEPLRARRATLRSWGYRFARDSKGASYAGSLDLGRRNVIPPAGAASTDRVTVPTDRDDIRVGRDDHLGLRLVVADQCLRAYPRMCMHEGASLDGCPEEGGALRCPWHGARVAPVATFDLTAREPQVQETPHHRIELSGGAITIAPAGESE